MGCSARKDGSVVASAKFVGPMAPFVKSRLARLPEHDPYRSLLPLNHEARGSQAMIAGCGRLSDSGQFGS